MPSRPRPLKQPLRRLVPYAPLPRRRTRAAGTGVHDAAQPANPDLEAPRGVFAERRAALPVALLLPRRGEGRPAVLTGAFQRWLAARWMWVKPRFIPLLVATMGLLGVLNARSYLIKLARYGSAVHASPSMERAPDLPSAIHETRIH
ncbi:MAG TPA: hypothetical protein VFP84_12860 [Kofleriaceae bacterium]|nr:hypothetical protein [Kofleriaceae bacterium]